jgi:hypothetical protein
LGAGSTGNYASPGKYSLSHFIRLLGIAPSSLHTAFIPSPVDFLKIIKIINIFIIVNEKLLLLILK